MKLLTGARPSCSDTDLLPSSSYCLCQFIVTVDTDVYFNKSLEMYEGSGRGIVENVLSAFKEIYTCSDVNGYWNVILFFTKHVTTLISDRIQKNTCVKCMYMQCFWDTNAFSQSDLLRPFLLNESLLSKCCALSTSESQSHEDSSILTTLCSLFTEIIQIKCCTVPWVLRTFNIRKTKVNPHFI